MAVADGYRSFTPRERQIFDLLLAGWKTKEIAYLLELSERTIDNRILEMCDKAGVRGRMDLILSALGGKAA